MWRAAFEGGSELAAVLSAMSTAMARDVMIDALKAGAAPMRDTMAATAARASSPSHPRVGHLADHVVINALRKGATVDGVAQDDAQTGVAVGPSQEHFWGIYPEFGTTRLPAQPSARPAFEKDAPGALDVIRERAWLAITRRLSRTKGKF